MLRYAFFPGCKIPYYVPHYGISSRRVLEELGIELVDMEFNCCGYPMSHLYYQSSLLASARALAMAEAQGLDILTPCKCCFGSFKRAMHALSQEPEHRRRVEEELRGEGLAFPQKSQAKHLYSVLFHDLGLKALRQRVTRPYEHLRVAAAYGCHALRPSEVTGFDHPWAPSIIDQLVEATGAQSVPWAGKLSCCGAPLLEHNPELSLAIINRRLSECHEAKADVLCIACPYSQMQAQRAHQAAQDQGSQGVTPGVVFTQILGLALGISAEDLALTGTSPDPGFLQGFLSKA